MSATYTWSVECTDVAERRAELHIISSGGQVAIIPPAPGVTYLTTQQYAQVDRALGSAIELAGRPS
jgi:hypothetical protein